MQGLVRHVTISSKYLSADCELWLQVFFFSFLFFYVARPRHRLKLTKAMDSTGVLGLASDTDTPNDANGAKQQQQQSEQQQQQQQHCNWLWQQQQQEYKFSPFILASSHDLCEIIIGEFLVFTTRLLSAGRRHYNNLYTNVQIYISLYT